MSTIHRIVIYISVIEAIVIAGLLFLVLCMKSNQDNANKYLNSAVFYENGSEVEDSKTQLAFEISASLVWWDQDNGMKSIENNYTLINSISPFWYELTADGEINAFSGASDKDVVSFLKSKGIEITPIVSNEFESEPLSSIIADPIKMDSHINDILHIAENFDGISLNYENLNSEDKENFTNFASNLAEELHSRNKTLSVHLHAKTDENGTWNGPQSQDWEELAKFCDKLKIMAYDYHWSSSEAGAIAPPVWVEEVLINARNLIPSEKIYLGIPLYGYDWVGKEAESLVYTDLEFLFEKFDKEPIFDEQAKTYYFNYEDSGDSHEVWFENAESIDEKLKLAEEYEIGGVDFFRLGGEDPEVWNILHNYSINNE